MPEPSIMSPEQAADACLATAGRLLAMILRGLNLDQAVAVLTCEYDQQFMGLRESDPGMAAIVAETPLRVIKVSVSVAERIIELIEATGSKGDDGPDW